MCETVSTYNLIVVSVIGFPSPSSFQSDLTTPQNAHIAAAFEIDVHRLLNMIDLTETINGATCCLFDCSFEYRSVHLHALNLHAWLIFAS
jgi:hypothetical protein